VYSYFLCRTDSAFYFLISFLSNILPVSGMPSVPSVLRRGVQPQMHRDEFADARGLVDTFYDVLGEENTAWFTVDSHGESTHTPFISRSPDEALQWICGNSNKKDFLRRVNQIYLDFENPLPDEMNTENDDELMQDADREETAAAAKPSKKAGQPAGTTRARNKAVRDRVLVKMAETWGKDATKEVTLDNGRLQFMSFFNQYPLLGEEKTWEMIRAATAIQSGCILADWSLVMQLWRHRQSSGRTILDRSTQVSQHMQRYRAGRRGSNVVVPDSLNGSQPESGTEEDEDQEDIDEELGMEERRRDHENRFKELFGAIKKAGASSIIDVFTWRWMMTEIYEESKAIQAHIVADGGKTGQRGCRIATVARQRQLHLIYGLGQKNRPMTKTRHPAEWNFLDKMLTYGKKWNMLVEAFGYGILGLLPPTEIPNRFIERTLSTDQVVVWVKLLNACIPEIQDMCVRVEGLYLSCVAGRAPPVARLVLEASGNEQLLHVEGNHVLEYLKFEDEEGDTSLEVAQE
jgi:hypothetical protein